jgi:hypothetical protein
MLCTGENIIQDITDILQEEYEGEKEKIQKDTMEFMREKKEKRKFSKVLPRDLHMKGSPGEDICYMGDVAYTKGQYLPHPLLQSRNP